MGCGGPGRVQGSAKGSGTPSRLLRTHGLVRKLVADGDAWAGSSCPTGGCRGGGARCCSDPEGAAHPPEQQPLLPGGPFFGHQAHISLCVCHLPPGRGLPLLSPQPPEQGPLSEGVGGTGCERASGGHAWALGCGRLTLAGRRNDSKWSAGWGEGRPGGGPSCGGGAQAPQWPPPARTDTLRPLLGGPVRTGRREARLQVRCR